MAKTQSILGQPLTRAEIAIYIPSTHNYFIGDEKLVMPINPIVREKVVGMVKRVFIEHFFGASSTEVQGSWIDEHTQGLVHEDCTKIYALISNFDDNAAILLRDLGQAVKTLFNQDSVLITVNYQVNGWLI